MSSSLFSQSPQVLHPKSGSEDTKINFDLKLNPMAPHAINDCRPAHERLDREGEYTGLGCWRYLKSNKCGGVYVSDTSYFAGTHNPTGRRFTSHSRRSQHFQ
jgi:hypothetical protein